MARSARIPKGHTEAEKAELRLGRKVIRARPPKGVTLAPFQIWDEDDGVVNDRDAQKAAEVTRLQVGTDERLAKAPLFSRGADHVQRVTDAPLDVLRNHKKLAKNKHDVDENTMLYNAGNRFREHWNDAGLTGLSAMDFGRVGAGDGHAAYSIPSCEFARQNRDQVRGAIANMGGYLSKFVIAIVAEERDLEDVGRSFSSRQDRTTSIAIAVEVLRAGLTSLATYWGMDHRSKR